MIFVLTGLSGSGKTTIANEVSEMLSMPKIIMVTDRPIRPGEENGVDYYFYSKEEYDNAANDYRFASQETFDTAHGIWRYGILKESIKDVCIIACGPLHVKQLKDRYDVVDMFTYVRDDIRIERILSRKDNQGKEEIMRRDRDDKEKTFKNYRPKNIIDNSDTVTHAVNSVYNVIRRTRKEHLESSRLTSQI